jgi:hypothetical protein
MQYLGGPTLVALTRTRAYSGQWAGPGLRERCPVRLQGRAFTCTHMNTRTRARTNRSGSSAAWLFELSLSLPPSLSHSDRSGSVTEAATGACADSDARRARRPDRLTTRTAKGRPFASNSLRRAAYRLMCVFVCVRARVRVRACVRACASVCVGAARPDRGPPGSWPARIVAQGDRPGPESPSSRAARPDQAPGGPKAGCSASGIGAVVDRGLGVPQRHRLGRR